MSAGTIIIIIVIVLVLWVIVAFNALVRYRTRTKEAWADIDVQLKRRYNLIPNLVNAVKGYAKHEQSTLENVTNARTAAMQAGSIEDHGKAENMLTGALKSLFAVSENYPDLKANQNFVELQRELADTENKIQAARRFYNTNVRDLNIKIETFPSNIIARLFNFVKQSFFELEEGAIDRENVQVKF